MTFQVFFASTSWEVVEATSPEEAACHAVMQREANRQDYRVGCGGQDVVVRVNKEIFSVEGRMTPIYSATKIGERK